MAPDGRVADAGEVLEADPPRRLVLTWRHEMSPEMKAEGFSRLTYLLEQQGDTVKLTLTHEAPAPESKFLDSVSDGWPVILASLKSPAWKPASRSRRRANGRRGCDMPEFKPKTVYVTYIAAARKRSGRR